MIVVKKTENEYEKRIIDGMLDIIKEKNNISKDSLYFSIEDSGIIVGGCSLIIFDDHAIIDSLVIDKNRRGEKLGDGLLRAVLNYCLQNGLNKTYFIGDNQYLIKKGFYKVNDDEDGLSLNNYTDLGTILKCDIEDFFKCGCSSCRRS